MGQQLTVMNEKLDNLESGNIPPAAREIARKLTFAVRQAESDYKEDAGHGLLIRWPDDDSVRLLCAAHVVAFLVPGKRVQFRAKRDVGDAASVVLMVEGTFAEPMYIPKLYFKDGRNDIGMITVDLDGKNRVFFRTARETPTGPSVRSSLARAFREIGSAKIP